LRYVRYAFLYSYASYLDDISYGLAKLNEFVLIGKNSEVSADKDRRRRQSYLKGFQRARMDGIRFSWYIVPRNLGRRLLIILASL
jgi:hypothetical protein